MRYMNDMKEQVRRKTYLTMKLFRIRICQVQIRQVCLSCLWNEICLNNLEITPSFEGVISVATLRCKR